MARLCCHELWARFQGFINDGHLMRLSILGHWGGCSWREILLQQQKRCMQFSKKKKKWCMQGNAEVEREMELYGLGQKGGMAAETREWQSVRLCVHGKRIVCMTCLGLNGERVCGRLMNNSNYATILTSKRLWSCPPCTSLSTRGFQTMTRGKCVREGLKGRCSSLKPS